MANVFLVDLEAVDSRYTGQWKTHVPKLLEKAGHNVRVIEGPSDIPSATTPGLSLTLVELIFTKLGKLRSSQDYSPKVALSLVIILFLLMLGILESLT
jgi:hypothetical protein